MKLSPPSNFPLPWKVQVNPFGYSNDQDNIFIIAADGTTVAVITKHPVWMFPQKSRLELAIFIVELANSCKGTD